MPEIKEEFSIVIPHNDQDILENGRVYIKLHRIKAWRIWQFHSNDADPWPSDPHGHDIENGDKLDIYTGEIYSHNRVLIRKLSQKQLDFLHYKLENTHHVILD